MEQQKKHLNTNNEISKALARIKNNEVKNLLVDNHNTFSNSHTFKNLLNHAALFENKGRDTLLFSRLITRLEKELYIEDVRKILKTFLHTYPHIREQVEYQIECRFPTTLVAKGIISKKSGRKNSA